MNLNVNFEELRNLGNQVISKAELFDAYVRDINTSNNEIATVWSGQDANKYIGAVNEQAQYMAQLASTIGEIGRYLIKVGNAYEDTSVNNANSIN